MVFHNTPFPTPFPSPLNKVVSQTKPESCLKLASQSSQGQQSHVLGRNTFKYYVLCPNRCPSMMNRIDSNNINNTAQILLKGCSIVFLFSIFFHSKIYIITMQTMGVISFPLLSIMRWQDLWKRIPTACKWLSLAGTFMPRALKNTNKKISFGFYWRFLQFFPRRKYSQPLAS